MKVSQVKSAIKAISIHEIEDKEINELVTDSRKMMNASNALFIALKGANRDGHTYIKEVYDKGVRAFIIEEGDVFEQFEDAVFLKVNNSLNALQQLAVAYRNQFKIPVIGITGSNGKTIVKEWLFQLLAHQFNIARSPKSYNSQIGVPLSVWQIKPNSNLGIFEAGISQPGEMEKLEKIIHPEIGVFTNIGDAHSEGFLNIKQKIREKLILFRHSKIVVYCKDYHELNENIVSYRTQIRSSEEDDLELFTWSHKTEATLRITEVNIEQKTAHIKGIFQEKEIGIFIPFSDHASIENAIHCWCVLLILKIDKTEIQERMRLLQPVAMRLELLHGSNNCTLINDTYNSDLTSFHIALDFLTQQKQHVKKTIILSDMLQMSKPDSELYEEVAANAHQKNIHRIIGIGPSISKNKAAFRAYKNIRSLFFKSTEEFLKKIHLITFENEAILLKGARIFRFEKIEKLLEQKIHTTVLEINLSAIENNLKVYRSLLPPNVKMMVMVKAFSYGSGSFEIANLLQYSGVDYLTVAYADEGVSLRKAGITLPIMVMNPETNAFARMISWKLEPEIFSLESLHQFEDIAQTLGTENYPIHIKLDTGMHRLGFMEHEIEDLKTALTNNRYTKVVSIFSHLAGSDTPEFDDFTQEQEQLFKKMSGQIREILKEKPLLHILNSAGITRHKKLHHNMVRLGIGLYGIDTAQKIQKKLQPASTLKTTIAQIKEIPANATVGYSRNGRVTRNSKIATVSIGYADGYSRDFGNGNGFMLVNGKKAPVIGSVCMDMCMLDITDIKNISVGDEVVVFGAGLPLVELADWAKTIPYEIMTSISQRVNRVYVNE